MLDWLRRMLHARRLAPELADPVVKVCVVSDPESITLTRDGASVETLRWADLGTVGLVTSETAGSDTEIYWVLQTRDRRRSLAVPMGAKGEHDLVQTMQARLYGFDNMAVIEAMSASGNSGFTVWDSGWQKPAGKT